MLCIYDNVTIAHDMNFTTHDSSISRVIPSKSDLLWKIEIGENGFIFARTTILYEESLVHNIVVAKGSVVTCSFTESNVVIGGNTVMKISYGRTYTVPCVQRIATIPIGYADGFRRMNGQQKYSLCLNGKSVPVVGRVCMDQLMVDVTDIECEIGEEILVFGDVQPYTVEDIARINDTINYEIVCDVGKRVARAFIRDGEIIEWRDDICE